MDLIDRQQAIDAVQKHFDDFGFAGYQDGQEMMDRIKDLPSVQKTGHWDDSCYMQRCSVCGGRGKKSYKYCPYCGSLNRGEEE